MDYKSIKEMSMLWEVSERTIREYCSNNKVPGAMMVGKTWLIPADAERPNRKTRLDKKVTLLDILQREKESKIKGGIYHKIQIDLTYNSNHIEGSKLTHDQTRYIYETNTVGLSDIAINVDDIIEANNHFRCIDYIIDNATSKITESSIKKLHLILKNGTKDSQFDWFNVGDYKQLPNEVGGKSTTAPNEVKTSIQKLLEEYYQKAKITFNDILDFHHKFECIHPFQDGNGRVGRLLMFKECLKHNITPFIITEDLKMFYYRGLNEWKNEQGYLLDTCGLAQDRFKQILDYFMIKYED